MKLDRLNRKIHYWGSIICSLPVLIIIITGLFLIFKKQSDWVQPPTIRGEAKHPTISFPEILEITKTVSEVEVEDWSDINRLDVRPNKGVIKVRAKNNWELQIDSNTGEILYLDFRRSDIIEDLHTGAFFHKTYVAYGVFLPASVILLILWITGLYLFIKITLTKSKNKKRRLELQK